MIDPRRLDPVSFIGEEWIEYGPERRRIGFHDYAALYAEPGLYERVFRDRLGLRTAELLVERYGDQLRTAGRQPADERVLDVGAGNGIGGRLLGALGVPHVVGVDLEPVAAVAAERDHPGAYERFLVGDAHDVVRAWDGPPFTAVLALASVGVDAVGVDDLLELTVEAIEPSGLLVFAVSEDLAEEAGRRLEHDPLQLCSVAPFLHRLRPDGSEHRAVAFVAQTAGSPRSQRSSTWSANARSTTSEAEMPNATSSR